ncbi:MAG: 30S ribosomal protein S1 [Bacteroidetes bacterium]|nr:30S ribosomal protein S1 [Bacteroidota bacterium]
MKNEAVDAEDQAAAAPEANSPEPTETTAEAAGEEVSEAIAQEETTEAPVAEAEATAPEAEAEAEVVTDTDDSDEDIPLEKNVDADPAGEAEVEVNDEEIKKVIEEIKEKPFNWNVDKRGANLYSEAEIAEMEEFYDGTFSSIEEHAIIDGRVSAITDSDVVLDVGFKADGLVSRSEFRDLVDIKVGDIIPVYVESKEDYRGQLILSRRKAKLLNAWDSIVDSYKNDTIIKGKIVSKTKGGLIVDAFGLETFLPGSQIDVKPIIDYDAYVGKIMEFKVVKINESIKNAVVSHKALIESDLEEQRQAIISKLEKGQVLEGTIKNITDFGAFIDLGGVDGLLYITDISWGRINHPNEVLELNQTLNVVVLDFDDNKKRISLGLKQLQKHPWDVLAEDVKEGSVVKGKVVNIEDYGAFIEITPGVEGLVHVSEVSWSNQPINSRDYFKLGDEHEAAIVTINREDRKMSLSIKQLSADPWEGVPKQYPVGSKHVGAVKNITPYGVFVEMDENIGGMVHISDLSWTKRFNHPNDFTRVGEDLDVIVLEIDMDNRKIVLGHKQLEEDPWDTFESVFPVGSVHEATVVKREDKGAIVQLPYGIEAFAPSRHIKKEDGTLAEVEETMDFKVLEFSRDDKRIIVSHTRVNEDVVVDEKRKTAKDGKSRDRRNTRAIKNVNARVEKTTLGELDVLSALKAKMEGKAEEADTAEDAPEAAE